MSVILLRMGKKDLERGDIHASSDEEDHIELSEEEALKKKAEEEEELKKIKEHEAKLELIHVFIAFILIMGTI